MFFIRFIFLLLIINCGSNENNQNTLSQDMSFEYSSEDFVFEYIDNLISVYVYKKKDKDPKFINRLLDDNNLLTKINENLNLTLSYLNILKDAIKNNKDYTNILNNIYQKHTVDLKEIIKIILKDKSEIIIIDKYENNNIFGELLLMARKSFYQKDLDYTKNLDLNKFYNNKNSLILNLDNYSKLYHDRLLKYFSKIDKNILNEDLIKLKENISQIKKSISSRNAIEYDINLLNKYKLTKLIFLPILLADINEHRSAKEIKDSNIAFKLGESKDPMLRFEVKALQMHMNILLKEMKYETIDMDGDFGIQTCQANEKLKKYYNSNCDIISKGQYSNMQKDVMILVKNLKGKEIVELAGMFVPPVSKLGYWWGMSKLVAGIKMSETDSSKAPSGYRYGADCSGFVSRIMGLVDKPLSQYIKNNPITTHTLMKKLDAIESLIEIKGFNNAKIGDAMVRGRFIHVKGERKWRGHVVLIGHPNNDKIISSDGYYRVTEAKGRAYGIKTSIVKITDFKKLLRKV